MTSETEKIFAQGDRSRAPLEAVTEALGPAAQAILGIGDRAGWHPTATVSRAIYALEIILNNLLYNQVAFELGPDIAARAGKAEIAGRAATKQEVELAVIAAGLGIPKEDLK